MDTGIHPDSSPPNTPISPRSAGAIWKALSTKGELSLSQLKKATKGKPPIFDWAVGWLARKDKIVITPEKRLFRVRLRETQTSAVFAS